MSTIELKSKVIDHLNEADEALLEEILLLVEGHALDQPYKTSASEKASIIEAIDQIANGEYLSNDDVDAEIDLWLNK